MWSTRGFNAEAIENKSRQRDIMTHEVLGTVYRVALLSSGNKGEQGDRTSHSIGDGPQYQSRAEPCQWPIATAPLGPSVAEAVENCGAGDDSDSSSSTKLSQRAVARKVAASAKKNAAKAQKKKT